MWLHRERETKKYQERLGDDKEREGGEGGETGADEMRHDTTMGSDWSQTSKGPAVKSANLLSLRRHEAIQDEKQEHQWSLDSGINMYSYKYHFIVMLKYERQDKSANTFDPSPQPLNPPTYFMSYSTNSMDKVTSKRGQEAVT